MKTILLVLGCSLILSCCGEEEPFRIVVFANAVGDTVYQVQALEWQSNIMADMGHNSWCPKGSYATRKQADSVLIQWGEERGRHLRQEFHEVKQ